MKHTVQSTPDESPGKRAAICLVDFSQLTDMPQISVLLVQSEQVARNHFKKHSNHPFEFSSCKTD